MTAAKIVLLGETGFVFNFFHRLSEDPGSGVLFLEGIGFDDETSRPFTGDAIKEICLFPNFGRRLGLGQPDAVVFTCAGRALLIDVGAEIDPERWNYLVDRLIEAGSKRRSIAGILREYKATPLYRLERLHMLGSASVRHIREQSDAMKRYCGVLPFSDQFEKQPIVRDCALPRDGILQDLLERARKADERYLILLSIREKPLSETRYLFKALNKMGSTEPAYRHKLNTNMIKYSFPPNVSRSGLYLTVAWALKHPIDIGRVGYFFFRPGQFAMPASGPMPEHPGSD